MARLTAKQHQKPNVLPTIRWNAIFVALIFLFNPNINVIDFLPDFIAYFIIAKLLTYPADLSPYFEEARSTFVKLGWLNVLKLPAILIVVGSGVGRGDTTALLALGFGVGDLILGIMATKYLFDALFYLGERTNESRLIMPFSLTKRRTLSVESYRVFTLLFVGVKCAIATLPEFLLLTENTAGGIYTSANMALYPMTVVLSQLLGLVIGIIWLNRCVRYAKTILHENALQNALSEMFDGDFDSRFETKFRLRSLFSSFSIIVFSSFLAFAIRFDDLGGAPLIPACLFPLVLLYAIFVSRRYFKNTKMMMILGLLSAVLGLVETVCSHMFFGKHTLEDIYYFDSAKALYRPLEIVALISCVVLIVFLVVVAKNYRALILENTGILPTSESYRSVDKDYHSMLSRRCYLFFGTGILLVLAKCAEVFFYGSPRVLFTDPSDVTMPVIVSSAVPWFSALITFISVAFILSALYFFSTLKDEVKLKYEYN